MLHGAEWSPLVCAGFCHLGDDLSRSLVLGIPVLHDVRMHFLGAFACYGFPGHVFVLF